jgi:hypothetical protein
MAWSISVSLPLMESQIFQPPFSAVRVFNPPWSDPRSTPRRSRGNTRSFDHHDGGVFPLLISLSHFETSEVLTININITPSEVRGSEPSTFLRTSTSATVCPYLVSSPLTPILAYPPVIFYRKVCANILTSINSLFPQIRVTGQFSLIKLSVTVPSNLTGWSFDILN